jgi:hypothetical protein
VRKFRQVTGTSNADPGRTGSRWLRVATVAGAVVAALAAAVIWWGTKEGYLRPLNGYACAHDYYPTRSFDELVNRYGVSPYCARRDLGTAWF